MLKKALRLLKLKFQDGKRESVNSENCKRKAFLPNPSLHLTAIPRCSIATGELLTYSLMLNVVLFAITPDNKKPDKYLIGKMNRLRSLRNDYMHYGKLPKNPEEVRDLFESTKRFIEYLRELDIDLQREDLSVENPA
jgi:hypothetical protein